MSDSLVTPDITYVSLNFDNPDLKKIMPWAGTSRGPESTVKTFVDVSRYWEVQSFQPEALFGSEGYAAMFGRFTYKSIVLSKVVDHAICGVRKSRAKPLHLHGGYVRNGRVVPKRRDLEISKQSQRRAGHDLTGLCSCWGFPDRRLFNIVWSNCITGVRGGDGALAVCGI